MPKLPFTKSPKKFLLPGIIVLVLLLVGAAWLWQRNSQQQAENTQKTSTKKKVSQPVNVIPVADRPYMTLTPSSDGHYITLAIKEVKKDASKVDYEMEYQTGSMLQGFQGLLTLKNGQAEEKKLFGSQSAGGAITYHEDITGGSFLAQFEGGSEDYAVKSAWRYFTNKDKESSFSSQDGKFSIENASLAKVSHLVIYNVPGYPGKISQELLSDPYALSADSSLESLSSNFTVTLHSSSEEAVILGYDGQKWQELDTSVSDGKATTTSPYMPLYVLAKK